MRIWTVLEMLRSTSDYLAEKGIRDARLNADLLLAGTLGCKRLDLYLQYDRPLTDTELAEHRIRLRRRARREPLQYIDGRAAFRDLWLDVDPRVLIPRPETEQLVSAVLEWTEGRNELDVVDVGTGCGAIALSLACEGPMREVVATDSSAEALEVARNNAVRVAPRVAVEFLHGPGYAPVSGRSFDIVVSNPPYVAVEEGAELEPEVRTWEPADALFAGGDGLDVIRALVAGAPRVLRPGGLLALEIGATQSAAVAAMVNATPGLDPPRIHRDYAGRDRIVSAECCLAA
ncbi:peptide chain release factor N(5)-glutamine methyltransferase [soil metagenome]